MTIIPWCVGVSWVALLSAPPRWALSANGVFGAQLGKSPRRNTQFAT